MWLLSLVLLPLSFSSVAFAAGTFAPECPTYDGQFYTDPNGVKYTILCGADTTTGSYQTNGNVATMDACLSACDAAFSSSPSCQSVTFDPTGQNCYLKSGYSAKTTNANLASAVRYIPPPPYPVPQANYVNASAGCGKPLDPSITIGGASTTMTFVSPDGLTRNYSIHVPATYDINKAAPLIMSFHGRGDTPAIHEPQSGYSVAKWNPYGIAVYPLGVAVSHACTTRRYGMLIAA